MPKIPTPSRPAPARSPRIHSRRAGLPPGKITGFHKPGGHGVRVDTHVYAGYVIPPYYDSMIGKLIVTARTRAEVIAKMERALDEFIVEGIKTTIPFHRKLMQNEIFRSGIYSTKFIEENKIMR